jgi:hypothetical protein
VLVQRFDVRVLLLWCGCYVPEKVTRGQLIQALNVKYQCSNWLRNLGRRKVGNLMHRLTAATSQH